ncbi:MAG: redoxin domain-containing protein [Nitrospirota bacterium]
MEPKKKATAKIFPLLLPFFLFLYLYLFALPVSALALLQTGAQAPEFALKDIDGRDVSLSRYSQKKAVIVLFWSTWSANSPKAVKRFEEFHRKYRDRGIQVIGINADNQTISKEDVENIKKFVKEMDVTFPVILDKGLKTFHDYGVIALPSTVVISEGKITYEMPGLPLVGTEDMFDYLLVLAGETPKKKIEPRYAPHHDAVANANLAMRFVNKKMYGMAYPLFRKAIEKDPKYMLPYMEMAKLYNVEGKLTEAEETLRKALSVEPDNVVVIGELGYILSKAGKIKEAMHILERVVKLNSHTPIYYYYAYALAKNGRMKEAMNAFDKAIALNPYEPMIYLLRAEVLENSGMLKETASDYRKAIELILKIRE